MADAESSILIVDDDNEDLSALETALDSLGCAVHTVTDPHDVLPAVYREQPDVVVLDALLPGLSGFDLCKQIKTDGELKGTQVVIVTGVYLRQQYRQEALQQFKADGFLTKPFRTPELQRLVVELLAKKTRRPPSSFLSRLGLPSSRPKTPKKRGLLGRLFGKEEAPPTRIAPAPRARPRDLPKSKAGKVPTPEVEPELQEETKSATPLPGSLDDAPELSEAASRVDKAAPEEPPEAGAETPEEPAPEQPKAEAEKEAAEKEAAEKEAAEKEAAEKEAAEKEAAEKEAAEKEAAEKEAAEKEAAEKEAAEKEAAEKEAAEKEAAEKEAAEKEAAEKAAGEKVGAEKATEVRKAPATTPAQPSRGLDAVPTAEEDIEWTTGEPSTPTAAEPKPADPPPPPEPEVEPASTKADTAAAAQAGAEASRPEAPSVLVAGRRPKLRIGDVPLYDEEDFYSEFKRELSKCRRVDRPLTLILIQVNDLTQIVEMFGKEMREAVLWHVAEHAMASLREVDLAGMMSSKDLIALTAFASDKYGGGRVVSRIRKSLQKSPFDVGEELPPVVPALQFGMSSYPDDGDEVVGLIAKAFEDIER